MSAPVVRPWQWQDHPTRWAPGDEIVSVTRVLVRRGWYGWVADGFSRCGPYFTDAEVDEWVMCGTAVPLVEHGNPIAGRP